jgi:hypothetical protein
LAQWPLQAAANDGGREHPCTFGENGYTGPGLRGIHETMNWRIALDP